MASSKCLPATLAILIPNAGGFLGSISAKKNMEWYESLKKPNWKPPNWAFCVAWTGLYSGMGLASYIVWKHGGHFDGPARLPLMVYGGHLALNWAWTPIFFGAHKIELALYDVLALDAAAAITAILFYNVDQRAGLLFLPYLAWLGLATALNYRIHKDNNAAKITETTGSAKITEIKDK